MPADHPLVSVVIPAYNAAATLERALRSALDQTYHPKEIIVVNDASRDTTGEIADSFADHTVHVIHADSNAGEASTRNRGIAAARGAYIAFLDADDEWLPGKLEAQVAAMEANPSWSICTGDTQWFTADGRFLRASPAVPAHRLGADAWQHLLAEPFINASIAMVRTRAIRATGGFAPSLKVGGDQDMWIRLALIGGVGYVERPLARVYVMPHGLMNANIRREKDFLLPMIRRHVEAQRHRLSDRQVRQILATRYACVGQNLYCTQSAGDGLALLVRAILMGHQVRANFLYILRASPPARALKRLLRERLRVQAT